jgi:predicted nucleic-acid-binding protein
MIPGSISLDTSCVLRLLVAQPLDQYFIIAHLLDEHRASQGAVHVSDLVLAEAYFALHTFYSMTKADALASIANFARLSGITITPVASATLALPNLASAKPGFVDRLIHGASHAAGHTLVTFEKAAKKLPDTVVLSIS